MAKVSVIVPNHGRDISELERSLDRSTYHDIELIHIDAGKERSEQRNVGIKFAKGEYLLFLDSDQSVSRLVIAECVSICENDDEVISIYIPEHITGGSFFSRVREFERQFYTGTPIDVPRFVRREFCPQFDTTMSGPEDADWGNRIPGKRAIAKNCIYHNDHIKLMPYIRKKAYYTKSMKRYIEKWPSDEAIDLKYRCFFVFIENGKWKRLIRHPVLSLGVLFILAIRGVLWFRK